jgi:hypothetical protein
MSHRFPPAKLLSLQPATLPSLESLKPHVALSFAIKIRYWQLVLVIDRIRKKLSGLVVMGMGWGGS